MTPTSPSQASKGGWEDSTDTHTDTHRQTHSHTGTHTGVVGWVVLLVGSGARGKRHCRMRCGWKAQEKKAGLKNKVAISPKNCARLKKCRVSVMCKVLPRKLRLRLSFRFWCFLFFCFSVCVCVGGSVLRRSKQGVVDNGLLRTISPPSSLRAASIHSYANQVLLRIISFASNAVIVRVASKEMLGVVNVRSGAASC